MTLTLEQARDAVLSVVDAAWKASGAPSEFVPMLYDDVKGDPPDADSVAGSVGPYARATVRILDSRQSTQGRQRRYLTEGSVTVQVFAPVGDGRTLADRLAKVVLDALRGHAGTSDGLWFFDVAPAEVGNRGPWTQTNVGASFRFQESPP